MVNETILYRWCAVHFGSIFSFVGLFCLMLTSSACRRENQSVVFVDDGPRYQDGFMTQSLNMVITGYYTPCGGKKTATYLKWNLDSYPIKMYLIDSSYEVDVQEPGGVNYWPTTRKHAVRASEEILPEQLQAICAALKKASEWSRLSAENNLNVLDRELFSRAETEFLHPENTSYAGSTESFKDLAITFSQPQGCTNYEVKVRFARPQPDIIGPQFTYVVFDRRGVEHFILAVNDVISQNRAIMDERNRLRQLRQRQEAQRETDAKKADVYLK